MIGWLVHLFLSWLTAHDLINDNDIYKSAALTDMDKGNLKGGIGHGGCLSCRHVWKVSYCTSGFFIAKLVRQFCSVSPKLELCSFEVIMQ